MTRYSGTDDRNEGLLDWTGDYGERDNLDFFGAAFAELAKRQAGGLMTIGLLGQRDLPGFTLRNAQSILRWDLRPSLWSHVFLVAGRLEAESTPESVAAVPIREVALYSRTGNFPDPANNAVTTGTLGQYARPAIDANVALVAIEMTEEEAAEVAKRAANPNTDRTRFDLWEMLGVWESYLWSSGARSNPLRDGMPIHASAFAEYCYEAIRVDLSPGASERNSAPEHIWNAAKWWHESFSEFGHPISGYYVLRDAKCSLLDPEELEQPTEHDEPVPA